MNPADQRAELAALGLDIPEGDGPILLTPQQLAAVLASHRRHRLEANALRRAVTDIDRGPQPPRYRPAELRQAIKTLEHRLDYLRSEVARRQAAGEDRGPLPREHFATSIAHVRLMADLAAIEAPAT
jgi:hypothetical protein